MLYSPRAAGAAPSCGRQVIDDWYDDGRVDRTYALHCYDDAIEALPPDVRHYSSAQEDIERASRRAARRRSPAATTDPSPARRRSRNPHDDDEPVDTDRAEATPKDDRSPTRTAGRRRERELDHRCRCSILAGLALLLGCGRLRRLSRPPVSRPPHPATGCLGAAPGWTRTVPTPEAVGEVDTDSASSVPIPLLVLAGLALLLIAGGSAGYFVRRYQGRNNPPPAV